MTGTRPIAVADLELLAQATEAVSNLAELLLERLGHESVETHQDPGDDARAAR